MFVKAKNVLYLFYARSTSANFALKSYNGNKQGIIEMIVTNVFDAKLLSKVIISNFKSIQKNVLNVRLESDIGYNL